MIVNTERDLLHGGRESDKIGAYLGLCHYDVEHRMRSATRGGEGGRWRDKIDTYLGLCHYDSEYRTGSAARGKGR